MIDRIGRIFRISSANEVVRKKKEDEKAQTRRTDGFEPSAFAQELSRASQELKRIPDVREERVQELRQQISAGKYEVDFDEVARRLVWAGILKEED